MDETQRNGETKYQTLIEKWEAIDILISTYGENE